MARAIPGLPQGWTEHSLNGQHFYFHAASGTTRQTLQVSADDSASARALRLAAAQQREDTSASSRRTMDEWRQQQRHGGGLNLSPREEMVQAQALQMSPRSLQVQSEMQSRMQPLLQPAPTQVTSGPAQRGAPPTNSVQVVAIHPPVEAMHMAPPANLLEVEALHAPVEAMSNPRPRPGGCPRAVEVLLYYLSALAFAAIIVFVVKHHGHIPLPRHFPHQMHCFLRAWKLPIILALATVLCGTAALIRYCRKREQISASEEGLDQPGPKRCRKRVLIICSIILGLLLVKGVALAAHGRLHLPIGHHHGHQGWREWQQGYGDGDGAGDGEGYGDGDGDDYGDGDGDGDADAGDQGSGRERDHQHAGKREGGGDRDREVEDPSEDDLEGRDEHERDGSRERGGDWGVDREGEREHKSGREREGEWGANHEEGDGDEGVAKDDESYDMKMDKIDNWKRDDMSKKMVGDPVVV